MRYLLILEALVAFVAQVTRALFWFAIGTGPLILLLFLIW